MNASGRRIPGVFGIVSLILLAGCGGGDSGGGAGNDVPDSSSSSATTTSTRPTTTAKPRPKLVSVSLPGLPIGGQSDLARGSEPGKQCAAVGWDFEEIPEGAVITVTDIRFEPDAFDITRSRDGCQVDGPACLGHTLRGGQPTGCLLIVVPKEPITAPDAEVKTRFHGEVNCRDTPDCRDFIAALSAADTSWDELHPPGSKREEPPEPSPETGAAG